MTRTATSRRSNAFTLAVLLLFGALWVPAAVAGAASSAQSDGLVERVLGERLLTLGSWGADVFELQRQLIRLGFDIKADGLFGPQTRQAVIQFQTEQGLKPDGIVGPLTLQALKSALEAQTATITHVVEPGDSLWALARRYNTTMERIVQLNQLQSSLLRVGQQLLVPAPPTYTVQPGDTLTHIAIRFRTTVAELAALNNLSNPDFLRVGQVLLLPRTSR